MSESVLLKQYPLVNGLLLEAYDTSRHYYGGYWRVVIEARCQVPLTSVYCEDVAQLEESRRLLGDSVLFVRQFERMAVPQDKLEQARNDLLERFERHLLPLVENERFAARFIAVEVGQRQKRVPRGMPCLL